MDASITMDQHTCTGIVGLELPLWDTLAGKMSKYLNRLCVAEDNKATIRISVANLLNRARIVAGLAVCQSADEIFGRLITP